MAEAAILSANRTSVTGSDIAAVHSLYYPEHNYDTEDGESQTWQQQQHDNPTQPRVCGGSERTGSGSCVIPEQVLMVDGLSVTVNGFVMPVAVAATVVTNALVCVVLLRKSMRTPTNILLVAMAVSDMMTGLSTMPAYIRFYTFGGYRDFTPYSWSVTVPFITYIFVSL
jgi:hypothetical protein